MMHRSALGDGGWIARVKNITGLLGRFPDSLLQLLARIAVSGVFFKSGLTKIANWDTTVQLFNNEYMVPILPPEVAAHIAVVVELGAPVLLLAGLATRLGTLPLLGMTLVIQSFVYPENWVEHLTWATLLLYILTRGPGSISLDHVIERTVASGRRFRHEPV
jgi:putative oxidoreductase